MRAIVGGGNSAGQAAIRLSRYAARVTLLVRGSSLEASMSQYLISQLSKLGNVDVRTNTEVVDMEADSRLRALMVRPRGRQPVCRRMPSLCALEVCHARLARQAWGSLSDRAGYVRTGAGVSSSAGAVDGWQLPWSTSASLKSAPSDVGTQPTTDLPGDSSVKGPSEEARAEFSRLASGQQIRTVANALERSGVTVSVVESGEQARYVVRSILPPEAEVYNNTSRTLEVIGVAEDIERSGRYEPLRPRLYRMDREMQGREMRQLSAAPDWVVGSVHAVTEDGSLLIASASGSQLGPIVSGAGHVILVIGGQKIVANLTAGLRRIYEYCFPLEDRRARQAYGVPSGVNNILIINHVTTPGRVTAILVNKTLGF